MAIVEQLKRLRFENNHLDRAVEARRLVSSTWNSIYVCRPRKKFSTSLHALLCRLGQSVEQLSQLRVATRRGEATKSTETWCEEKQNQIREWQRKWREREREGRESVEREESKRSKESRNRERE